MIFSLLFANILQKALNRSIVLDHRDVMRGFAKGMLLYGMLFQDVQYCL